MADGKKTSIGTENYFSSLNRGTIFDELKINDSKGYTDFIKKIVKNAMDALAQIYSDINSNIKTVKFLDSSSLENVGRLAENLYGLRELTSESARITADNIKSLINNARSRNSYYISDIERAGDEMVKNNPLRLSEREAKELISKALNYGTSAGNNEEQKEYIDALFRKYDKDMISATLDYLSCDSYYANKSKNGCIIGSSSYIEAIIRDVFGCHAVQSSAFSSISRDFRDGMKRQIEMLIGKIKSDVNDAVNSHEYMEYKTRCFILELMSDLSRYTSSSYASGLENELLKLRRLEDFDNKVIEINKTGLKYPVDVELKWENGKNVLYIFANINFKYLNPILGIPEAIIPINDDKKTNAINGFKKWENGGSEYKSVFGSQVIKVVVNIKETVVDLDSVTVYLDMFGDRSAGWGGIGIIGWTPESQKVMFLTDAEYEDNSATHEFGHMMGLGDAYRTHYILEIKSDGVDYNKYPAAIGTVMDDDTCPPTSKDVEMVINAFYTGIRQNFQREFKLPKTMELLEGPGISPILGK